MVDLLAGAKVQIDKGSSSASEDDVSLLVNGKLYEGWEDVAITRSLRAISGGFTLGVSDRWGDLEQAWQIVPGDECQLKIGKESLITGFVDRVSPAFTAGSRKITVAGRDKTADMVDSSAIHNPGSWMQISLLKLAKILAQPFGVKVTVDPTATAAAADLIPGVTITHGETSFELLEKYARQRGVLLTSDGAGGILITKAGTARANTSLVQGENLLEASADYDYKDRFSNYTVKFTAAPLSGDDVGVDLSPKGSATDPDVKRYRPLLVIAETATTPALCRARAQWEAKVRAGKSSRMRCSVVTWRQGDGSLWKFNTRVQIDASWLGVKTEMLISTVTMKKGNDGTITELELERVDAYSPDPTLKKDPLRQLVLEESKRK